MKRTQALYVVAKDVLLMDDGTWWVVRTEHLHIKEWGIPTKGRPPHIIKFELLSYDGKNLAALNAFRSWHEYLNVVSNIDRETFYKSVGYVHS